MYIRLNASILALIGGRRIQSTLLGQSWFMLFVNDLSDWVKSSIKMFADDTELWSTIRNASDGKTVQDDLNNLKNWSDKWLLKCNPNAKTEVDNNNNNNAVFI